MKRESYTDIRYNIQNSVTFHIITVVGNSLHAAEY
jgi:hypothetical protein